MSDTQPVPILRGRYRFFISVIGMATEVPVQTVA